MPRRLDSIRTALYLAAAIFDKSKREDGTFAGEDFRFDEEQNIYICPAGKILTTTGHIGPDHATLPGVTA